MPCYTIWKLGISTFRHAIKLHIAFVFCAQALRNGIRRTTYVALEYFACGTRISTIKCVSLVNEQEKESFSLVDAGSDLLGALGAGITMATAYHDVSGLLVGPLAVGI